LLASFGEAAPSGENLEYEKVFTDLLLAARPDEERQMGDSVVAGQEPDAKLIVERAEAVLESSHDLRAAILLAYGLLRVAGFSGFATATSYLRGCLEEYWDTCHPQLDADDDNDPTERVNAVLGLVDAATMMRAVRLAPLTQSPAFGRMSLRDLAIADGEIAPPPDMDNPPDPTRISAAFQDTPDDQLAATLEAARTAQADLVAINAVFDTQLPGQGPDLDPLIKVLHRAVVRLADEVGEPEPEVTDMADTSGGAAAAPAARAVAGEITSSHDVEQAIDRIMKYYSRYEPSSPVPMILARAKRLVGADFLTIMADIAPAGQDNVKLIGGIEDE
jgi:type VI secretion system protein ImpA